MDLGAKKRVVLINPPSPWLISDRESSFLGILYIAAFLRENQIDVQVVDLASIPEDYWFFPKADIYGITATSPHFIYAKKISEMLKKRDPNALLIIGGVHATSVPDMTLKNSVFDAAAIAEAEETMLELAMGKSIPEVLGLYYKDRATGQLKFTGKRPPIANLDAIPFPARDMVDTFSYCRVGVMNYLGKVDGTGELSMITSRGCPYDCAYCSQKLMAAGRCRFMSAPRVAEEVRHLIREYGVGRVNFVDDMFTTNKKRLLGICEEMKKIGIQWQCLTRADDVDYDTYVAMKESGCVGVTFGIESGSQKILDLVDKKIKVATALKGITDAHMAGLKVRSQMVVGLPGEDDQTIEETKEFMKTAPSDVWSVHVFVPFPGCAVWRDPERYDFPVDKDTDFSTYHTVGKPGEWHDIQHRNKEQVLRWKDELIQLAKDKNVFKFDPIFHPAQL